MTTADISETGIALEPVGVEGCATCAALAESREIARSAHDRAAVSRCNREIGNHPHRRITDWRRAGEMRIWGVVQ
jgi:hypothetical protein